jgi:hypothetical protein
MADYKQKQFFGTAQTVINTATDVAANNFSGAPAAAFDNTSDGSVPYAALAQAMIELPDWGGAPVAGELIELWGVLQNTDGTDDDTDAPATTASNGARYFGAWVIAAADALQRRTITISLEGVNSTVNFYIKNGTSQNLNNDGGTSCVVKITPFAYGVTV